MNEGDNPPIGLVLCADKKDAVVKYTLSEDNTQIFASKYKTYLSTEEELKRELNMEKFLDLNPKDFPEDLQASQVDVLFDHNGAVVAFRILYSGQYFSKLHSNLSKKYKLVGSNTPFVGDHSAKYEINDIVIKLEQPQEGSRHI